MIDNFVLDYNWYEMICKKRHDLDDSIRVWKILCFPPDCRSLLLLLTIWHCLSGNVQAQYCLKLFSLSLHLSRSFYLSIPYLCPKFFFFFAWILVASFLLNIFPFCSDFFFFLFLFWSVFSYESFKTKKNCVCVFPLHSQHEHKIP